jgi:hypothetical protein
MTLKRYDINFNSLFFYNVVQKILPQIKHPTAEVHVAVVNKERSEKLKTEIKNHYKFVFDYPEDNNEVMGLEVFEIIGE